MAAHTGHPTRSRRFIKVYLSAWALLAVGALAYLGSLALAPQGAVPVPQAYLGPPAGEPGESKALAEVRSIRGSLSEIRKDVSQLQDAAGERAASDKAVQTRLSALEGRVSTIDGATPQPQPPSPAAPAAPSAPAAQPAPAAPPVQTSGTSAPLTAVPGIKVVDVTVRTRPEPRAADTPAKAKDEPAPAPSAQPPFVPIETGSLGPKAEIVFGEPVVTPAGHKEFAVQLAAAPSLQALRQSWGQLSERHAGALGRLQPRVVAPRSEGGPYRLLAGPMPTKADAERICSQIGVSSKACFVTTYTGTPL